MCIINKVKFVFGDFQQLFTTASMVLIDSVVIIRYVMIFCLKNPGDLDDHFWNVFTNLWIYLMATISQIVYLTSSGHWNMNFYICSGLSPYKVSSKLVISFMYVTRNVTCLSLHLSLIVDNRLVLVKTMLINFCCNCLPTFEFIFFYSFDWFR